MKRAVLSLALAMVVGCASAQEPLDALPAKEITPPGTARGLVDACDVMLEAVDRKFRRLPTPEAEGAYFSAGGYCAGYLEGFRNGYMVALLWPEEGRYCQPEGVTVDQMARLLSRRLEQSPEMEHLPQLGFVAAVLATTWPCSN